jgi:hypothetical protein
MNINLTWDLFIIVFFTVIIAYTFIIGRNQSVKIIISAYIAILASDSIGNLLERYFMGDKPIIRIWTTPAEANSLIILKILIFIITIVLITTRGRFNINMSNSSSTVVRIMMPLAYGILSAGLITSTVFIYASGASLIQIGGGQMNEAILAIYKQSQLVRLMINNYNVWFSLPAIAFVVSSFFGEEAATV